VVVVVSWVVDSSTNRRYRYSGSGSATGACGTARSWTTEDGGGASAGARRLSQARRLVETGGLGGARTGRRPGGGGVHGERSRRHGDGL